MTPYVSRAATAFALAASLTTAGLVVPVSTRAATPRQQQSKTTQENAKPDSKSKSDAKAKTDAKRTQSQTQSVARPLDTNEDPAMIGKRNINKGGIGIVSKMSGSLEKEVSIGRQIAAEIDKQSKQIDDPVITEYVNRVGQNIVLHSDAKIPFTIKVIDSDEVNAFALPGGFFYVNKGLLLAADNESEIAGVMAHEIAHVAARHYAETQAKGTLAQIGLIASSIFLGGIPGAIIQNTAGLGLGLGFAKFSRGAESEADRLGVQYLYAAGYDPNGMSTMFEKLASQNKKKPGFFSKAFASHPQSIERLEASRSLIARFPEREEYVLSTSEFQRVKARLLRMSNARASSTGDIAGGADGAPGRPTLKRRQPEPDATTTGDAPIEQKPSDRPTLRRRDVPPPPADPSTRDSGTKP
jgi:predicted Zn-dependent protease